MKVNKNCKTCEFCFPAPLGDRFVCAGEHYGESIDETDKARDCWSISLSYWQQLVDMLGPNEKGVLVDCPFPSMRNRAFKAAGAKNGDEYLFYCVEQLPETAGNSSEK